MPELDALETVLDKAKTSLLATQCDVPIPSSWDINTSSDLESIENELTYPVVIKPGRSISDTTAFNAMAAYRTETLTIGAAVQVRHTPQPDFTLVTVDAAFEAEIGRIDIRGEVVGRFGRGDLTEDDTDVRIAAGGVVLEGGVGFDWATVGIVAGLATGDADPSNATRNTFTFDRDYNVGLLMFEQPMPSFAAAIPTESNGGRNFDEVVLGNAISNALFVKPRIQRSLLDKQLELEASLLWARMLAAPDTDEFEGRQSYGFEVDAVARYTGLEHFELGLTGAILLPGSWFTEVDGRDLSQPVFGAQLLGRVVF